MKNEPIHSMISTLETMPGLLEVARPDGPQRPALGLKILLLVCAGLAHGASIAWPFEAGFDWGWLRLVSGQPVAWLQGLSLVLLVLVLERARSRAPHVKTTGKAAVKRAAWSGGLFAASMLCSSFWWLYISMHDYGGLAAPLAALAVLLLALFLALYYVAAAAVYVAVAPRSRSLSALLFAACWLLAELARVRWLTGFPWGEGGYAHVDGAARALAPWVGVHGLTFLVAWAAAQLALALYAGRSAWPSALLTVTLSVGVSQLTSAPGLALEPAGRLSVTLLQGNIPQDEKFQSGSGVALAMDWYAEQLSRAQTELVVTPETAIVLLPQQLPPAYWQGLQARFSTGQQAALIGLPLGNAQAGYTNSVLGLKPTEAAAAPAYRYDKHHLVPFGEFVPPGFRWFVDQLKIPLGDFGRGSLQQASFAWQGQRLGPNICYEDLFGEELAARFTPAEQAPTILVNLSNIAWFGNTVAIDQHLHISRLRAMELGRPMLRATNTGATAIINAHGQVTDALPRHTRQALVGEVQGQTGITPYVWWVSRWGLWPLWALGLSLLGGAWWARRRGH